MKIGTFLIHRKEQWDLKGQTILCIHKYYDQGSGCKRIFCITKENGTVEVTGCNPLKYRWKQKGDE